MARELAPVRLRSSRKTRQPCLKYKNTIVRFGRSFGLERQPGPTGASSLATVDEPQPFPLVRVIFGPPFFSRCSMMIPATFFPVVVSIPSSPGDEFTSITNGP